MTNTARTWTWDRWIANLFSGFAAVLLFAMMTLTFVDVILRYWFNSPIPGGFEVTELLLASLIFSGLPLVTLEREHVNVDLFDRFVPKALHKIRDAIVLIVCHICVGVLAWRMWIKAKESLSYGDITSVLELPLAPVFFLAAATLALTAVIFLMLAVRGGNHHAAHQSDDHSNA